MARAIFACRNCGGTSGEARARFEHLLSNMKMNRRQFLKTTAAAASVYPFLGACEQPIRWEKPAYVKAKSSRVAILAADRYPNRPPCAIFRAIRLFQRDPTGKGVLLRPN